MKQNKKKQEVKQNNYTWMYWIPACMALLFIPFFTRYYGLESRIFGMSFASRNSMLTDLELYGKQVAVYWAAGLILVLLAWYILQNKKELVTKKNELRKQLYVLIPLGIYFVLVLLSSICSEYKFAAFTGSDEQFESAFAVMGYVLLCVYFYFLVNKESAAQKAALILFICMAIASVYGIFQYLGYDFINFEWFQKLIMPAGMEADFGSKGSATSVFLSSYNSNYAGVLLAVLSAFCLGMLLTERRPRYIVVDIVVLILLLTCLIGTGSRAGLLVFLVSAGLAVLYLARKLLKYWYFLIPAITFVVLSGLLFIQYQNLPVFDRIQSALSLEKHEENPLKDMVTTTYGMEATYKGVPFAVEMDISDGRFLFAAYETETEERIELELSEDRTYYTMKHEVLDGVTVRPGLLDDTPIFIVTMNGEEWMFAMDPDGVDGFYFVNPYYYLIKLDKIERIGFYGHERFASGRGFIWSQTLPLLKKHIFLGSGANTFVFEYPQENYVDMYYFSGSKTISSRPHCMYLQIAVESGVVSLIALVVFWAWYLLQSVGIYFKSKLETMTERVGFACFLAVFVYLVCGLTNDSMVTVAPVFWCILGLGLATNRMVKEEKKISEMK